MDELWRAAVFRDFHFWDKMADAINPTLGVALLLVFVALRQHDAAKARLWGWRALFSIVLAWAIVRGLRLYVFTTPGLKFPSGHLSFALCAALALANWKRETWKITLPILVCYSWLMTALRFHSWLDLAGALAVALLSGWSVERVTARRFDRDSGREVKAELGLEPEREAEAAKKSA